LRLRDIGDKAFLEFVWPFEPKYYVSHMDLLVGKSDFPK